MIRKIVITFFTVLLLSSCNTPAALIENKELAPSGYEMISAQDLQELMRDEEVTLVNVHIPMEGSIPDTDLTIPYNEVDQYLDQFPADKDEKIVIYCRSGSMGDEASQTLADLGYTNVWNLEGGYNVWNALGLPFEE
ncbi:MAG TPA: rhodanese-like domain-containing protein [Pelolinea sp.]|nr:rhodanese-like domain-containing protein [Pelolinea sp.]